MQRYTPGARRQSSFAAPVQDVVKVAVLPARLPADMAPPTGLGPAMAISWDERVNWRHNESIDSAKDQKPKSIWKKAGFTRDRKARNEDLPPFTFREVPYDTWRKHYAKDAGGRYKGTHAPAEDCLLLPADVEIWSTGERTTKADQWTRGKDALPVYDEARSQPEVVPAYEEKASDPNSVITDSQRLASVSSHGSVSSPGRKPSTFTADGKGSEQIIAEAKERAAVQKAEANTPKGWKNTMKRGAEYALMGTNA